MHHPLTRAILPTLLLVAAHCLYSVRAQETDPGSARELAARLSASAQDGASSVRVRIEIRGSEGGPKSLLQLQIKARRSKTATEVVCQVIWPKERRGESFLLRSVEGGAPSGAYFIPPDSVRSIDAAQMKEAVFGSDLSYADFLENFFAWEKQSIVGTETVDRVACQVLESRPGEGDHSIYGRVLSWIDPKRLVPLRVEKYFEVGQLARRIETRRVAEDDTDRKVAASLAVRSRGQDSVTELDGSKSRHDVSLSDADFTIEALRAPATQRSNAK